LFFFDRCTGSRPLSREEEEALRSIRFCSFALPPKGSPRYGLVFLCSVLIFISFLPLGLRAVLLPRDSSLSIPLPAIRLFFYNARDDLCAFVSTVADSNLIFWFFNESSGREPPSHVVAAASPQRAAVFPYDLDSLFLRTDLVPRRHPFEVPLRTETFLVNATIFFSFTPSMIHRTSLVAPFRLL